MTASMNPRPRELRRWGLSASRLLNRGLLCKPLTRGDVGPGPSCEDGDGADSPFSAHDRASAAHAGGPKPRGQQL